MNGNYRPLGWVNPYVGNFIKEIAYENMADSIIEQIKKEGIKIYLPPGYVYDAHAIRQFCEALAQRVGCRGWIVFLPDTKPSSLDGLDIRLGGG